MRSMPSTTSRDLESEINAGVHWSKAFIDIRSPPGHVSLTTFKLDGKGYTEHAMTVEERGARGCFLDDLVSPTKYSKHGDCIIILPL